MECPACATIIFYYYCLPKNNISSENGNYPPPPDSVCRPSFDPCLTRVDTMIEVRIENFTIPPFYMAPILGPHLPRGHAWGFCIRGIL